MNQFLENEEAPNFLRNEHSQPSLNLPLLPRSDKWDMQRSTGLHILKNQEHISKMPPFIHKVSKDMQTHQKHDKKSVLVLAPVEFEPGKHAHTFSHILCSVFFLGSIHLNESSPMHSFILLELFCFSS